jgi:hypothetical protein
MKSVMNSWAFGGVRLSSLGAVTELDSYLDLPPKRGDNILIPFRDGRVHVDKYFEQRVVSFGIEVSADRICDLEDKFDIIKALFGPKTQQYLSYISSTGPRQALAEVVGLLNPTRNPDPLVAKIVVDFLLAEPYFRAVTLTTLTETMNADKTGLTWNNPGSAQECNAIIILDGQLNNTIITNNTNGAVLNYWDVIAGGEQVVIDCKNFTAVMDGITNVIGYVAHTGVPSLFALDAGDNDIDISDDDEAGGVVTVTFYPPNL